MKRSPLLLLCLLAIFITACGGNAGKLREHGQEVDATLTRKQETTAVKATNRHYTFTVSFFAQDAAEIDKDKHANDVLKDTTMSMADRIEKWEPGGGNIGDYTTVDIDVERAVYDKYNEGDKVRIVYLPEDPKVAMLKEQL
jgi:hypothetical protein